MAKVLSRPMFKRGGKVVAKNSGIVSGFADGGDVRQGFQNAGMVDLIDQYVQAPQQQRGLSRSDYLRIASAGAEIMGAPPTGRSGFIGALQAASPALSNLGTGLADDMATRDASYQTKLGEYNTLKARAAMEDESTRVEIDQARLDRELEATQNNLDRISDETIAEIDKLKITQQLETYVEQTKILRDTSSTKEEKQDAINMLAIVEEQKTKLKNELILAAQTDPNTFQTYDSTVITDQLTKIEEKEKDPNQTLTTEEEAFKKKYAGRGVVSIQKQMALDDIERVFANSGFAKGGRVGLANGGGPYEPGSGPDPDPGSPPIMTAARGPYEPGSGPDPDPGSPPVMQAQASGISFEELRARLPKEVTDLVVKLLATSESALMDFANIQTQEDISQFNQKYNTNLLLPTQVA